MLHFLLLQRSQEDRLENHHAQKPVWLIFQKITQNCSRQPDATSWVTLRNWIDWKTDRLWTVVLFSFSLKLEEERDFSQSKKPRKVTTNNTTLLVICHNNKVCYHVSFQTNQNAVFMDERREFKIQWLFCRLTFPRTILLAGLRCLSNFCRQDICTNSTLSEPARRLDSSKFFAWLAWTKY